jgi:hypothetical protein
MSSEWGVWLRRLVCDDVGLHQPEMTVRCTDTKGTPKERLECPLARARSLGKILGYQVFEKFGCSKRFRTATVADPR